MLLFQDTRREGFRGVFGRYSYACLNNNRPPVDILGHKMHAGAMLAYARLQGALMGI